MRIFSWVAAGWAFAAVGAVGGQAPRELELRTRVEVFKGSNEWREVRVPYPFRASGTAMVVCDMWDNHWCRGAAERVTRMAPRMNRLLEASRKRGVVIVHAPSNTLDFYREHPARLAVLRIPPAEPPAALVLSDPKLPIDDSDGGCDTPGDKSHKAWTRQHPALRIDPKDFISDNGREVYSLFQARGIRAMLIMGVHTNMCVLNRSFAIRQMTRWGVRCILVRDLTDAMYDPADPPHVSHEQGTELVIQHIEKHWAPTVLSTQLLKLLE
jgi:nicotinamidase-related amidase